MTPYYQEMLQKGLKYQDFVMMNLHREGIVLQPIQSKEYQLKRENLLGMEIKFDDRRRETGNFYFELYEKSDPQNEQFVTSGILRNDYSWLYAIGDYSGIYICSKKKLQQIYEKVEKGKSIFDAFIVKIPTSIGMVIPEEKVKILCEKYVEFING